MDYLYHGTSMDRLELILKDKEIKPSKQLTEKIRVFHRMTKNKNFVYGTPKLNIAMDWAGTATRRPLNAKDSPKGVILKIPVKPEMEINPDEHFDFTEDNYTITGAVTDFSVHLIYDPLDPDIHYKMIEKEDGFWLQVIGDVANKMMAQLEEDLKKLKTVTFKYHGDTIKI